jgi:hypothetical protein|nr:MAG TPA: Thymidylate kinase [Caudoviricetes sp.]
MKQKIKEALKQKYGTRANKELGQLQLGIGDEVFERVAASVETFITDESAIEGFVNSENTLNLLKSYQSVNDKLRAFENKPKPEPTPKPSDTGNQPPESNPEPKPQDTPDIAALIEAALDKKLNPITERLNNFETAQSQKSAVAALEELKATWDYAKGYPDESEYAYNMAMGIYNGIGKTWTAEQLTAKYKETFNERVSKKGIDTTKPFQSDGGAGGEAELDMTEVMKIYQKSGRVQGKE